MANPEKISDRIIEKAVDLWCEKLMSPSFDNGDRSEQGFLGMGMAAQLAENARTKDHAERVEKFRTVLTEKLKFLRDNEGQPIREGEPDPEISSGFEGTGITPVYYFGPYLDVDYRPCRVLAYAADEAGISHRLFSIKSSVYMFHEWVNTSFGYGVPDTYYYPLEDGKWFVAGLRGADIEKIITAFKDGRLPEFN